MQIVKEYRIPFLCRPKQKREPKEIKFSKYEKEAISLEVENLLKKGAVEQACPQKAQFLSNIFIVKMTDRANGPVINLKELNQYIPFLHFKMEFSVAENCLTKKRVHVQIRPQGCIFLCPTFSAPPKQSDVSMRRKLLPVFMSVLWPCTSPIRFRKTPKYPRGPFKDRDTHSNLFGHVDYWQNKGRDYSSTRYSNSFTSVPGICYKSEKVSDDTSSGDIISGNDSQFKGNDYFPST